ncbi:uncharacterized protein LOC115886245 [Sitophilus oryzae]|uniref:Uncharacterized protein LOC115886245 n=1 Tax=Sitophilus oryzae TaxID=7048 RepID=A0A6J2YCP6_SITOR|nr:uncharacterized protein LOC115886245 [Sitophilus oryzae]
MKKNKEKVDEVERALKENKDNKGNHIRKYMGEKMETLFIRGIDAVTSKEEVISALKKEIADLDMTEYKLGDLRPMSNDTQAITLNIIQRNANLLLNKGYINIGYVRCSIEKKINVMKCRKCWEYGHDHTQCSGPNRLGKCFKCGEDGHTIKDCKNNDHCPLCQTEGHMAGSGKCKLFKTQLSRARRIERNTFRRTFSTHATPHRI